VAGGARINEALTLAETDLEPRRGSILARQRKGGKRREVGMDEWAWEQLRPWQQHRLQLPVGPFLCVIDGATRGRSWSQTGARAELRRLAAQAGVRRRFAPHQLRHADAVDMARECVPLPVVQRQRGHAHLGVTSTYLRGIDTAEIIDAIHGRRPPMIPASAGLRI
jgi:site-specific recombinase XerD